MLTGQPQAVTISYPCSGVSNEPAFAHQPITFYALQKVAVKAHCTQVQQAKAQDLRELIPQKELAALRPAQSVPRNRSAVDCTPVAPGFDSLYIRRSRSTPAKALVLIAYLRKTALGWRLFASYHRQVDSFKLHIPCPITEYSVHAALNGTGTFAHAFRFDRLLTEDESRCLFAQAGTLPRENAPTPPTCDEVRWADDWDTFRLQGGPAWDKLLDAMIDLARYGAPLES